MRAAHASAATFSRTSDLADGGDQTSGDSATLSLTPDESVRRRLHSVAASPLAERSHLMSPSVEIADDSSPTSEPLTNQVEAGPAKRRVELLQHWQGVVRGEPDVNGDFEVTLEDITDRSRPDEAATMSMAEVSNDDRSLVVPGAVFYVFVGRELDEFGQLSRFFRVRFRRLPRLTASDLLRARRKSAPFAALLGLPG